MTTKRLTTVRFEFSSGPELVRPGSGIVNKRWEWLERTVPWGDAYGRERLGRRCRGGFAFGAMRAVVVGTSLCARYVGNLFKSKGVLRFHSTQQLSAV